MNTLKQLLDDAIVFAESAIEDANTATKYRTDEASAALKKARFVKPALYKELLAQKNELITANIQFAGAARDHLDDLRKLLAAVLAADDSMTVADLNTALKG